MKQTKWILMVSLLLCLMGIGVIVVLALLGKGGELEGGRLSTGKLDANLAALALYSSPLVAIAALCIGWRQYRRLAVAGLLAAVAGLVLIMWGNLTDYLSWSRLPPPTDQVTYLAGFFGMLGTWAVCLAYGVVGLVSRYRWFGGPRREGDRTESGD